MKYWINCLSKNHVLAGVEGGFTQAANGKADPMRRLNVGDIVFFYSEGTTFRGGTRLQAFTAVGRVAGKDPFQEKLSASVQPWRRRVEYIDAQETSLVPLLPDLACFADKTEWGKSLKGGFIEIGEADAAVIAAAMSADITR